MPHPIMFRDDDPGHAGVRKLALSFPEACEKVSWGRPVFYGPKMFVMYGDSAESASFAQVKPLFGQSLKASQRPRAHILPSVLGL